MKAAPPSCRVATTRIPAPSNASSTPRNDSPGTVNAIRTPAARNASAMKRPTVRGPAGSVASSVATRGSSAGTTASLASVPGTSTVAVADSRSVAGSGSGPVRVRVGSRRLDGRVGRRDGRLGLGFRFGLSGFARLGRGLGVVDHAVTLAVVLELQRDRLIELAQLGHDPLQVVL